MQTYTRIEAAEKFAVSNTIIARNLKAIETMGFGGLLEDNRLTERAIYLIELYRAKDFSMLDDELAIENEATEIEAEVITEAVPDTAAAGAIVTMADRCSQIAANVGTVEVMDATPYEERATAARSALAKFVEARNARSHKLAHNAATKRRTIEQIAVEHAVGDLMTYTNTYESVLAEGMQATQSAAVEGIDSMGKPAVATR
jgi:hypothetical protein